MPSSRNNTKEQILQATLAVLKDVGSEGLTLRKVAAEAGLSLGNLQYHYPGKSALLGGLCEDYFEECRQALAAYQPSDLNAACSVKLEELIRFYMDHVDHLSDMCRVFREIWALSTREEAIAKQMASYYQRLESQLQEILGSFGLDAPAATRISNLLLPYFEGYSIVHDGLSAEKEEIVRMLSDLSIRLSQT